mgnify:CR=1 FL=1
MPFTLLVHGKKFGTTEAPTSVTAVRNESALLYFSLARQFSQFGSPAVPIGSPAVPISHRSIPNLKVQWLPHQGGENSSPGA